MANDLSEYSDVIGQLSQGIYTPICLCFPVPDASYNAQIVDTLAAGIERLSSAFPWLAGQVISEVGAGGGNGRPTILPLEKASRLIVKDLTHDAATPSMNDLRKAKFPFSMLQGRELTSLKGLPSKYGESEDPTPVFFVEANFINGGLLLSFAGDHGIMDGQGLGQIIRILSKACHMESFTNEELLQGNRSRGNVIPLLDQHSYKPGPELDHLIVKPSLSPPPVQESPTECIWAYFHFSASSLSKLKSLASPPTNIAGIPTVPYITTNDAISAFIWQSICRARSSRLSPHTTSTFARAVDVRSALSVPPTYLGNVTNHTYTTLPLSSVISISLGLLASTLRLALNPSDLSFGIRSLVTYVSLNSNGSGVAYGANMNLSSDMFLSSWAKLPCYEVDFNLGLGFPESVRRPLFDAYEGLLYLMPMDRSGGIDAAICLSHEDLNKLRAAREFGEYAEWIG
jgi:hypothetical protein